MSDTFLTEPIVLDETGQLILDKLDEIVSALNPNAQGVSFDKTGCEIITANNVQDALEQLDSGLDNTNSNLAQLESGNIGSNFKIRVVNNTATFTFNLGVVPSSSNFGQIILINANQNTMIAVRYGGSISAVTWQGTNTATVTTNGTVLTVTVSNILWGSTMCLWSHN